MTNDIKTWLNLAFGNKTDVHLIFTSATKTSQMKQYRILYTLALGKQKKNQIFLHDFISNNPIMNPYIYENKFHEHGAVVVLYENTYLQNENFVFITCVQQKEMNNRTNKQT
jgi:hypothetical protein